MFKTQECEKIEKKNICKCLIKKLCIFLRPIQLLSSHNVTCMSNRNNTYLNAGVTNRNQ